MTIARVFRHDRAAMTSVVQGGIRFNNYIAFPIAAGLFGQAGLAFAGALQISSVRMSCTQGTIRPAEIPAKASPAWPNNPAAIGKAM